MFKKLFSTATSKPEDLIRDHKKYVDAYKIVGYVLPSDERFDYEGVSVCYSLATLLLAVKPPFETPKYFTAWKSAAYKSDTDAMKVLSAECSRLSDVLTMRIEQYVFSVESNSHEISEIYNENDRRYLVRESNL